MSVMVSPLLRNAICWNRLRRVSKSKSTVSKVSGLGQKVTVVPVSADSSPISSGAFGTPWAKLMRQT